MNIVIQLLAELAPRDIRLWLEDGKLKFSAPEGAMTPAIRDRIVGNRQAIIDFLAQAQKQQAVQIAPRDSSQPALLSLAQQRLWFQYLLDPASAALNIPFALRVKGALDIRRLEAAFSEIVRRHEVLRTVYRNNDGNATASVLPAQPIHFEVIDCGDEARATELVAADLRQAFDLAQGVVRARLLRHADDHHVLYGALHHIAGDGASLNVLVVELAQLYHAFGSGNSSPLPALEIQYSDFAAWQHEQMGSGRFENQISYWKQRLAGAPDLLKLPLDRARPQTRSQHGAVLPIALSANAARQLPEFCRTHGVTSYMVLLAALDILLYRWSGQTDICVTSPVAGRELRQLEPLIGFFVNSVIQRTDVSGNPTVAELLQQIQQSVVAAFDHQDVPFDQVIEALKLRRYSSFDPLQQVAFSLLRDNGSGGTLTLDGLTVTPIAGDQTTAKVELTLALSESENRIEGLFEYNTDLFDAATIALLAQHYGRIVDAMIANPSINIASIALTDDADLLQLLEIDAGNVQAVLPMPAMARDLYLDSLLRPETVENSLGYYVELPSTLDQDRWQRALQWIDDQRDVLRTRIVRSDKPWLDMAYLVIAKPAPIYFTHHHIAAADSAALTAICLQPLDALGERLVRYGLASAGNRLFATFTTHHAVLDGKSLNQHLHDVVSAYDALGRNQPLAPRNDRIAELVAFNRAHMDRRETLSFWRAQLADCETLSCSQRKGDGDVVFDVELLPAALWRDLDALAQRHRSSRSAVIKSALALLVSMLHQVRGRFRLSEILGGRIDGHDDTLGLYIQNLQFVYDAAHFNSDATLPQLLEGTRQFKKALGERQYLSLFALKHLADKAPIDYQFNYRDVGVAHTVNIDGNECRLQWTTPPIHGAIQLVVIPVGDSAELRLHAYADELPDAQLLPRLIALLQQFIAGEGNIALTNLDWVLPAEREHVLQALAGSERHYPLTPLFHERFAAHAQQHPDRIAVRHHDQSIDYATLDARANHIASLLQAQGVGPDVMVGVCVPRGINMVLGALAIAKAGGAYVPIDPNYPDERIAFLLDDTKAPVILTETALLAKLATTGRYCLCLDAAEAQHGQALAPTSSVGANHMAYVIHTSGSTGTPKGVMVEHQTLIQRFHSWNELYRLDSAPLTHLQLASMSFDVFASDLVKSLCAGGTLVICDKDTLIDPSALLALMQHAAIDFVEIVPAVIRQLAEHCARNNLTLPPLSYLVVGADAWFERDQLLVQQVADPRTQVLNSYGLTEATVDSCYFLQQDSALNAQQMVPIGKPFPGHRMYVLDDALRLLPPGIAGELCVAEPGLARGYLNRPDLTAAAFCADPYAPSQRLYHSGDTVRLLPDGNLEFLGRRNNQVKIRGFRIELGEIEAALSQIAAVHESVVLAVDMADGKRLVAYVEPMPGHTLDTATLRSTLSASLPEHMVPSLFMVLEKLPVSPNGKLDRRALPAPDWSQQVAAEFIAPRNAAEIAIANIWCEVLGIERVSIHDNFFDLGGHSLLATRIVARVQQHFGIELPLRLLFEDPTVAGLAALTASARQQTPLLAVERAPEQPMPLSYAQQRLWMVEQFMPGNIAYNMPGAVRLRGDLDVAALEQALHTLQLRHEVLRTTFGESDDKAYQIIHAPQQWRLDIEKIELADEAAMQQQLIARASAAAMQPFDLRKGPLWRVQLYRLAPDDHVLLLNMHHIISDGWSLEIMLREIGQLYAHFHEQRDNAPQLPALPVQYADFSVWQRENLNGDTLADMLDWWKTRLAGAPRLINLPTDHPRPPQQRFRGAEIQIAVPAALTQSVRDYCKRNNTTSFMVMLAAYYLLLARYTNQNDICVATPVAGRERAELQNLIGFFVNSVVLRGDISGNPDVDTLVQRIRAMTLDAFDHQDAPFDLLVDAMRVERSLAFEPLRQVAFMLTPPVDEDNITRQFAGLAFESIGSAGNTAKVDLTFAFSERRDDIIGSIEYNTDLFERASIETMAQRYLYLLTQMLANPCARINEIPLVDSNELCRLLGENPSAIEAILPMPAMARDLYIDSLLRPDTIENSLGYFIELPMQPDIEAWRQALAHVQAQRATLRSRFRKSDVPYLALAYLIIDRAPDLHFSVHDWSAQTLDEGVLRQQLQALCLQPLAALGDALVQFGLVKAAGNRWFATLTTHHAVMDGKSLNQHIIDVRDCYQALQQQRALPQLADKVAELIHFNQQVMDQAHSLQFWRSLLSGCEPLEAAHRNSPNRNNPGKEVLQVTTLTPAQWHTIQTLAQQYRCSVAALLKAALGVTVSMIHQTRAPFRITEVLGGRFDGHEQTLGCYIQNLQFVFEPDALAAEKSLSELVAYTRNFKKALGDKQYLSVFSLKQIAEKAALDYQFNYRDVGVEHLISFDGNIGRLEWTTPAIHGVVQLIAIPISDGLADSIELRLHHFENDLHDAQMLTRLLGVIEQWSAGTEVLGALQWLDAEETRVQLEHFNFPVRQNDVLCLHQVFEAQVDRTPDAIAVIDDERQYTYRELDEHANRLAHHLIALGAGPERMVGLCVQRSARMTVALLAISKSGSAYAPIDPTYPPDRIEFMLQDTQAGIVVTEAAVAGCLPADVRKVDLDDDVSMQPATRPQSGVQPHNLAYIIYTSGSTGKPKGVQVEHQAIYQQFDGWQHSYCFRAGLVHLQMASLSFDVCTGDHIRTLGSGGTLVICPKETLLDPAALYALMIRRNIGFAEFVPVVLRTVIEYCQHENKNLQFLEYLVVGSDAWFGRDHAAARALVSPTTRFINSYGVTEATVDSTWYETDAILNADGMVSIGRPFPQNRLYVMDAQQRLLPAGIVGELCLGEPGLARGYRNRDDLTAAAFVRDPYGTRLYRTGDLARWNADGNVTLVGRMGNQVKIRGFRIELGEIEAAIAELEYVHESVVLAQEVNGNKCLVAYVEPQTGHAVDVRHMRKALATRLPEHMVPSLFVTIDKLPVTPNGKLDRRSLPVPDAAQLNDTPYEAPRNELETTLASIYAATLNIDRIGINDNFFSLGGHSLTAMQIAGRIKAQYQIQFDVRQVFETPTVAELAAYLNDQLQQQTLLMTEDSSDIAEGEDEWVL